MLPEPSSSIRTSPATSRISISPARAVLRDEHAAPDVPHLDLAAPVVDLQGADALDADLARAVGDDHGAGDVPDLDPAGAIIQPDRGDLPDRRAPAPVLDVGGQRPGHLHGQVHPDVASAPHPAGFRQVGLDPRRVAPALDDEPGLGGEIVVAGADHATDPDPVHVGTHHIERPGMGLDQDAVESGGVELLLEVTADVAVLGPGGAGQQEEEDEGGSH